ncbi:hypothetical protein ANCDUO_02632 [Ancylostoma duodenale]|uniref:Uncharacterized protein n=1 Tax=Ancylostoma duodenale TaxID=51022 RepID=A0A0C2GZY0_9BILA|nr:hypothetical protein ANCDUO_02632 [Ancylostoma duodenale]
MSGEGSDSDSVVRDVPSDHSNSCTPSTSGASSPCYSAPRRRKDKMRRKVSRSRYLLAIEDRNRLRKLAARKVRLASNTVSAVTFLRWKEKVAFTRLRQMCNSVLIGTNPHFRLIENLKNSLKRSGGVFDSYSNRTRYSVLINGHSSKALVLDSDFRLEK